MHGTDEYLESKVMTASPYQLHLMVVDGAIRNALLAEQALVKEDIEAAHFALNDSRGFVGELISGLNAEHAPEIVGSLKSLFVFVYRQLVEADLERDVEKIRDVLKILRMHRETWVELAGTLADVQQNETAAGGPPRPHIQTSDAADVTERSWSS